MVGESFPVLSVIPEPVVRAWKLEGQIAIPMAGGTGTSYRVGPFVLKATDDPLEAEWSGRVLLDLPEDGFRIPRPVPARDTGGYVVRGWTASQWVDGRLGPKGHWDQLCDAAQRLHQALIPVPCPDFMAQRTHRWARADRMAWGEASLAWDPDVLPYYRQLRLLENPVDAQPQIVHGDLAGNMLFSPGKPPAIIDFSPYWRDPLYALAIAIADGILWHGEDATLIHHASRDERFPAMLVRALLFRLGALNERRRLLGDVSLTELALMQRAIEIVRPLV